MNSNKYPYIAILVVSISLSSCNTSTVIPSEYYYENFQAECLGVELDGTQTLRVFGKGKNKADAIEQAKKNAIRDILFKGINAGSRECSQRPLINEVNAQEKYSCYFNSFFRDKGEYLNFVIYDKKRLSRLKSTNNSQENWGVVVTVDRSGLQQQLIHDNIIKP